MTFVSIFSEFYSFIPLVGISILSCSVLYLLYMTFTFVFNISKHLGSVDGTKRFNAMSFTLSGFSNDVQTQL